MANNDGKKTTKRSSPSAKAKEEQKKRKVTERKPRKTSVYQGVSWHKRNKKFRATIFFFMFQASSQPAAIYFGHKGWENTSALLTGTCTQFQ